MLVTLKELLDQAKIEHKAVGAFNGTTSVSYTHLTLPTNREV